jgi:formate hydrogenlyase transcriptional activator
MPNDRFVNTWTWDQLKNYSWPGNVRELRNQNERAMIVSTGRSLKIELPAVHPGSQLPHLTLKEVERKQICDVLERVHRRIRGKQGAAEILGVIPTTLHSRMKKLGISRPNSR